MQKSIGQQIFENFIGFSDQTNTGENLGNRERVVSQFEMWVMVR
jgi:hypothetical protein